MFLLCCFKSSFWIHVLLSCTDQYLQFTPIWFFCPTIGKGVRLASESLSIAAIAAASVQKSVHLGICRFAIFFLFWSASTQYFFRFVWTKLWVASSNIDIFIIESWHRWVRMARQASWLSSMPLPVWGCKIIAWGLALIFSWRLPEHFPCSISPFDWISIILAWPKHQFGGSALYVAPIGDEHVLRDWCQHVILFHICIVPLEVSTVLASPWCRHAILFHTCILNRSWTGAEQGVCYPIDSWSEANTSGSHHRRSYESNDAMHRVSLQWRYACICWQSFHFVVLKHFLRIWSSSSPQVVNSRGAEVARIWKRVLLAARESCFRLSKKYKLQARIS